MFIGNLLAYGFGHTGAFQPRIGKVNRIYRPEPGTVVIDIDDLARFSMPIVLHRRDPAKANPAGVGAGERLGIIGEALPAVLIEHPKRGWGIITRPHDEFWEHTPVAVRSGRRMDLDALGIAQDVTPEFCWFTLGRSPFPDLQPAYPQGAAARAADLSPTFESING